MARKTLEKRKKQKNTKMWNISEQVEKLKKLNKLKNRNPSCPLVSSVGRPYFPPTVVVVAVWTWASMPAFR